MKVSNILLLAVVINSSAPTHAGLRNAELQNIIEEEDKPSVVPPKSSVEHDNINQVTADESDRMLGGNKKNKIKKFLKKKFKKNGGGVLPWKKDAVSNRSVHMICVCI
jgi:hypothetical protein